MSDKPASMDMLVDIRRIDGLIQRRQITEARTTCDAFLMRHPERAEGWLLLARICQQGGDYRGMLEAARHALTLDPANIARFTEIEARTPGRHRGRRASLTAVESAAGTDSGFGARNSTATSTSTSRRRPARSGSHRSSPTTHRRPTPRRAR
jgi:hypothetical protein